MRNGNNQSRFEYQICMVWVGGRYAYAVRSRCHVGRDRDRDRTARGTGARAVRARRPCIDGERASAATRTQALRPFKGGVAAGIAGVRRRIVPCPVIERTRTDVRQPCRFAAVARVVAAPPARRRGAPRRAARPSRSRTRGRCRAQRCRRPFSARESRAAAARGADCAGRAARVWRCRRNARAREPDRRGRRTRRPRHRARADDDVSAAPCARPA